MRPVWLSPPSPRVTTSAPGAGSLEDKERSCARIPSIPPRWPRDRLPRRGRTDGSRPRRARRGGPEDRLRRHQTHGQPAQPGGKPRPEPAQRMGPRRQPDLAVVGGRQPNRPVDALQRERDAASAGGERARRADRDRVQRHAPSFLVARAEPARRPFIFDGEGGEIRGWSHAPPAPPATVDGHRGRVRSPRARSTRAWRSPPGPARLYATDFHNGARRCLRRQLQPVTPRGVHRSRAPRGFRAVRDPEHRRTSSSSPTPSRTPTPRTTSPGQGLGFVDVFDTNGVLLGRVASAGS